ncbi:MAG: xanthine dehydrogenase family protein subunit M [Saprospiraceae bacterium]|nr:xanthine dehydrogenase family protein subunit M [Saprospiraceae bacterium]
MIPNGFQYHRASNLQEALSMLAKHEGDAKLLAGGHSLIPAMKLRLNQPAHLIDISRLEELKGIKEDSGMLHIGAGVTHGEIAHSKLVKDKIAMLAEAADLIGDVQVRNVGTIGGSLAHADPAADWPALMLATEAHIDLLGPKGERSVAAEDFFTGFYMTDLGEDEIITRIRIPIPPAGTSTSYQKFMQPASRFAIVGCAAMITRTNGTCEQVRVAFTGVSDKPYRAKNIESALTGKSYSAESIEAAITGAAEGVDVMSDHFASEEYRSHLARVYAKRALNAAN